MGNALDFSIILAVIPQGSNQPFNVRRYNGKSHEHTNHIEQNTFYDFHIHMATERYQDRNEEKVEAYAEPDERYSDFHGALRCILEDCNFQIPEGDQLTLL